MAEPALAEFAPSRQTAPSRLRLFRSVPVVPPRALYLNANLADGGPIWPDFETRGPVRFNRQKPVDHAPRPHDGPHDLIDHPSVWCGFIQRHFGHLIADHLTRVLESLAERPDDLYLFITYPKGSRSDVPAYFWSIVDWYGLPRSQVRIITRPAIVAELRCAPQAEKLFGDGPSPRYLALLDANMRRNGLVPQPAEILYVTRAGQLAQGKGAHAGEGYLVQVLQSLGVCVLDPARAPLTDQLARYAGARTLVFAEGSALHGRQLLGRLPQDIVVLRRRIGQSVAKDQLQPRCSRLTYADTARGFACPIGADSRVLTAEGISFYDTAALFQTFAALGVDLASRWSQTEFLAAQSAEAANWLAYSGRMGRLSPASLAALSGAFQQAGLDCITSAPTWRRLNWHIRSLLLRTLGKIVRKRKPWSN